MAVSRRLRYEILRRDEHACRYCGGKAPDVALTVDHVIPVALGGSDEASNLVTACADCNAGKSSSSPDAQIVQDVSEDALRWSRAMHQAFLIASEKREHRADLLASFSEVWDGWTYDAGAERVPVPRPVTWEESVDRLLDAGLKLSDLQDAVRPAMLKATADAFQRIPVDNVFRYFCGICWRMVSERQEIARELLDAEPEA